MWNSNEIFTARGASRALELAQNLDKPAQLEFLNNLKRESQAHGLLQKKDVEYIYDTGTYQP